MQLPTIPQLSKPIVIPVVVGIVFVISSTAGAYVWAQGYEDRIAPNVRIGTIDVGGLDPETASQRVQERVDALLTNGVEISSEDDVARLALSSLAGTDLVEYAVFDVEEAVMRAQLLGHDDNPLIDTVLLLHRAVTGGTVPIDVALQEESLATQIRATFPEKEIATVDSSYVITKQGSGWNIDVVAGSQGQSFDLAPFFDALEETLGQLQTDQSLSLALVVEDPAVTEAVARTTIEEALTALSAAPYTLTYTGEDEESWEMSADKLATMIAPSADKETPVTVADEDYNAYLDTIAPDIEVEAQNARFAVVDGRVSEFTGSRTGIGIDRDATKKALTHALNALEKSIELVVTETEPDVTTDEVNDLGITEVLGVGTSSYKGSPANRIRNIRNGVNHLNGLLIAPGETFSLIDALSPFTYDNGYFPELVIKGDKIEPEMGGGLCQIGTTTFRATMNSGLEVAERRNHSLVVSYYNDPSNGNPGTDATIYEPAPDYKFKNDTENYILFQAEMLEDIGELRFTFWGTSDGRKGSYTPPVVHRWIGVGAPIVTETTELAPGVKQCQGAHVGADTSFTYSVVKPDGTTVETIFESHYRPLPQICLVGAAAPSETPPTDGEVPPTDETPPPTDSSTTPPPTEEEAVPTP